MAGFIFVLSVAAMVFSVGAAWGAHTPLVPTTLFAVGGPVLSYLLYDRPMPEVVVLLALAGGAAGGAWLYSKSAGWRAEWLHPTVPSRMLRIVWSALFLGVQASFAWGTETQLRWLLALQLAVGAAWAALLTGFARSPRVQTVADGDIGWIPTHAVAASGAPLRSTPDPAAEPTATLAAGLPVELVEQRELWARVACSNAVEGWVDSRSLVVTEDEIVPRLPGVTGGGAAVASVSQSDSADG